MNHLFDKVFADTRAEDARKAGIYPYFHRLESRQDAVVVMEGKRRIMLGSNNYLGLTACPEVMEAAVKAVEKYGTGCSGRELADFVGKEDAITFGTGFQTNLGVISALVGRHDYLVCDVDNHASIYSAARMCLGKMLRFKHNDMAGLEARLASVPSGAGALVVVDGVFSVDGDIANLPEICALAKKYGAAVMVDDAHGFGVLGDGGRGTASHFGLDADVDIVMGTFSKSLASLGGFAAGKREVIDFMRHSSYPFVFSASVPPASAAVALAALRYLKQHPELVAKLRSISEYTRTAFASRGLPVLEPAMRRFTPIIPIQAGGTYETCAAARKMFDEGVFVNPFIPPATPEGAALIRTSVTAAHTTEIIDEAADVIARALKC